MKPLPKVMFSYRLAPDLRMKYEGVAPALSG